MTLITYLKVLSYTLLVSSIFILLGCAQTTESSRTTSDVSPETEETKIERCDRYLTLQGNEVSFVQQGCIDGHKVVTRASTSQRLYLVDDTNREPRPAESGAIKINGFDVFLIVGADEKKIGTLSNDGQQIVKVDPSISIDLLIEKDSEWRSWTESDGIFARREAIVIY